MCSPAGTSEVFIWTFTLPADFQMNILLILTSINQLIMLIAFQEKWAAEQPCILLLAKKKGLVPPCVHWQAEPTSPQDAERRGCASCSTGSIFFACRTQNWLHFYTLGCCQSKTIPPTHLGSALAGFACPGCARIPVAIKSQVSFTLIRSLGKCRSAALFWLCFQKLYYSFCVLILLQLQNLGIKLSASLYLPLTVGQTLLAWWFLELNLVCF